MVAHKERAIDSITDEQFEHRIARRRSMSGESYEKARTNLLEYLKGSGRISLETYQRLKRKTRPRI
jgi:hypothetical protein